MFKASFYFFFFLSALAFIPLKADAQSFQNLEGYLNVSKYYQCQEFQAKERLKVAIIETSFGEDLESKRGKSLPEDFELVFEQEEKNLGEENFHGEYVLDVFSSYISKQSECKNNHPKLYLLPTFGYSQFKRAVDKAIELDVDIVLYNTVFEYIGNGDASDFVNQYVNRAIDHGILWINNVGNFGGLVYQDKILTNIGEESQVLEFSNNASQYRGDNNLYFACEPIKGDECTVNATLTWNAFQAKEDQGTDKDLNFGLFDEIGKNLESSGRKQTSDLELYEEDSIKNTLYAYERIQTKLSAGVYSFKIKAENGDWQRSDFFRLTLEGNGIRWLSQSPQEVNSVFPPADNPRLISVGAFDSPIDSSYDDIYKPDMLVISSVVKEEDEFRGSTIAATLYAAQFTLIKGLFPEKTNKEIYKLLKKRFVNNNCHFAISAANVSEELESLSKIMPSMQLEPSPLGMKIYLPANPYQMFDLTYSSYHFVGYSVENGFEKVSLRERSRFVEGGGYIVEERQGSLNTCIE